MKRKHLLLTALACLTLSGCRPDTILGFAIGDISGLWLASAYVYSDSSAGGGEVDLIARDGARFTMTVDNSVAPPVVGTTFSDGQGMDTSGGGTVDITIGTLTISGVVFDIDHRSDEMTITNSTMMYDFGSGSRSATLRIELARP